MVMAEQTLAATKPLFYVLEWQPTREKAQRRMNEAEQFVSEVGRFLRSH